MKVEELPGAAPKPQVRAMRPGWLALLALCALLPYGARAEPRCGDFLEAAGRKPPNL